MNGSPHGWTPESYAEWQSRHHCWGSSYEAGLTKQGNTNFFTELAHGPIQSLSCNVCLFVCAIGYGFF